MESLLNEAVAMAGVLMPIVLILVQMIKSVDINNRWLPFVSIGLGTAAGLVFGYAGNADLFVYGLAGFLAGAGASGLYDGFQSAKGE